MNVEFLKENEEKWKEYKQTEVIKHYDHAFRVKLYEIAREIDPAYVENIWCNECAAKMMEFVYLQYDKQVEQSAIKLVEEEKPEPKKKGKG